MFNSIGHWEGVWALAIFLYSCLLAVVKLPDLVDECVWAANFSNNLPQAVMINCANGLGEVDEGGVESYVLFSAFFLLLSCSKNHVHCSPSSSEAALRFWLSFSS